MTLRGVVERLGGRRGRARVRATRITSVDGQRIATPNDLRSALAPHHPGDTVSITLDRRRRGRSHTQSITLGTGRSDDRAVRRRPRPRPTPDLETP